MASVFSMIINGDLPGRFVWRDDDVVAFLTINPVTVGHVLVVPRAEVDHWQDISPDLMGRLTTVAQTVGQAVQKAFDAPRVGLLIAGLEVPHVHLHVFPAWDMSTFDLTNAETDPDSSALDSAASAIRGQLELMGHGDRTS